MHDSGNSNTCSVNKPRRVGCGAWWEGGSKGEDGMQCISMADSCWGLIETNKSWSNYPSQNNNERKRKKARDFKIMITK